MNKRKVYKNNKAEKQIRDSYDELLKMWDVEYRELDLEGQYGVTHVIEFGNPDKMPLVLCKKSREIHCSFIVICVRKEMS